MSRAFRRLSSPCHFPESNRGLIHTSTQLRRNCGATSAQLRASGREAQVLRFPQRPRITSLRQVPLASPTA